MWNNTRLKPWDKHKSFNQAETFLMDTWMMMFSVGIVMNLSRVISFKPAVLSVCLRKERWRSGCLVSLHLGLSGLVRILILQSPHNKSPGLALWVHTLCHADLYIVQRLLQIQAPTWPPLSRNQTQLLSSLSPLTWREERGRGRGDKVEHPQCLVLMLHWVCPITAVLSDWLCVGWWAL